MIYLYLEQIAGNIVAPTSQYDNGGTWLKFKDIDGLILNGTGTIDGKGSIWWHENVDKRPTVRYLFYKCYLFIFIIKHVCITCKKIY